MKKVFVVFVSLFLIFSSGGAQVNTLKQKEISQGWKLLFNGKDLDGWISVGKQEPPTVGWEVENGILTVNKGGAKSGGDIITTEQFSDFELIVDFKLTKGANSGIKYFFIRYETGGWLGFGGTVELR